MKQILIITTFFAILNQGVIAQSATESLQKEEITMEWKLAKNDTIAYKTLMHNVKVGKDENSSLMELIDDIEFIKKIQQQFDNTNLITYLTNSKHFNNVIEIEMIGKETEPKDSSNEEELDFSSAMLRGTLLRGSIKKSGEIYSFWLKRAQLNLVSMFFELPGKPVSIGDTWKLKNIALIGNDQNFRCEEAEKVNQVELVDIIKSESDTIAVLSYNIREYVNGVFSMNNPLANLAKKNSHADDLVDKITQEKQVTIDYSFNATAKFSVSNGKWISFDGIVSVITVGLMGNKSTAQSFALKEIE